MKITSKHKKTYLPLAVLAISFFIWFEALGTWLSVFMSIPVCVSLVIFLLHNGDRIGQRVTDWLNRDGWK